jgi:transposase InsO family protein
VDLRAQFINEYLEGFCSMTDLCRDYGISRRTGYKWVFRYETLGPTGLVDQSQRPHHCPRATDEGVRDAILAARRRHPTWGAGKLIPWLARREPGRPWPRRTTGCDLLKRAGLVGARRRRCRPPAAGPVTAATRPNQVWTVDFKGQFRTGDGTECYPLTLRDAWSRYVLRCDALAGPLLAPTQRHLARAFAEYGLPDRIRSDNGSPFASTGLGRLSQLSVWWIRLGIVPERIALGHPEQNGAHEQFHAVLKAETARPPAANVRAQQCRFARFCVEYNHERPHEALANAVPASQYHASQRPLPSRLPPLEYPGHFEIRRVSTIGQVSWRNASVFLSGALAGQDVAFEEVDEGIWTLWFATAVLGRFNERDRKIHPLSPLDRGRGAASEAGDAPAHPLEKGG